MSPEEKAALIQKNPLYGRVICRCETITEGEIVDAIHSPVPPCSIDGIKRRAGAGMGRCQGGFCGPRVLEILSRELGIPQKDILQDKDGTFIITGETKMGGTQA
jgi:glycerol-3-phosphate dehydrogenase